MYSYRVLRWLAIIEYFKDKRVINHNMDTLRYEKLFKLTNKSQATEVNE